MLMPRVLEVLVAVHMQEYGSRLQFGEAASCKTISCAGSVAKSSHGLREICAARFERGARSGLSERPRKCKSLFTQRARKWIPSFCVLSERTPVCNKQHHSRPSYCR